MNTCVLAINIDELSRHVCFYLANPLALYNKGLHLRKIVVVGNHICDDRFFIWVLCVYICTRGIRAEIREKLTLARL